MLKVAPSSPGLSKHTFIFARHSFAVLPTICYSPGQDKGLRARDAKDLFEPTVACIQLRRNDYLPQYMAEFIQLLAPQWTERAVKESLSSGEVPRRPVKEALRSEM